MKRRGDALSLCRGFIAAVSWIVPSRDRVRWRREWDAEIAFWWRRREEKPAFELFPGAFSRCEMPLGFVSGRSSASFDRHIDRGDSWPISSEISATPFVL